MTIQKEIPPEQIARIKIRYCESRLTPVADIAREEGVTESQIYRLRRRFDWPTRTAVGKDILERSIAHEKAISEANQKIAAGERGLARDERGRFLKAAPAPEDGKFDADLLVRALRSALRSELEAAQARTNEQTSAAAAANARALASLAQTLTKVREFETRDGAAAEAAPLDLAELRRELARRIERLRAERAGDPA